MPNEDSLLAAAREAVGSAPALSTEAPSTPPTPAQAPALQADPLLEAARDTVGAQSSIIRNNLISAQRVNPVEEGRLQQLAKTTGMPIQSVRAEPDAARERAALATTDADTLVQKYPHLAQFMSHPDNAAQVHPFVPAMANTEDAVKALPTATAAAKPDDIAMRVLNQLLPDVELPGKFVKYIGGEWNRGAAGINIALGKIPTLYDKLANTFTGSNSAAASDWWDKNMVVPLLEKQQLFEPAPDASFSEKAIATTGSLVGMLSQIVLTGGESAAVPAAAKATELARRAAGTAVRSMAFPAVTGALVTGRKVYDVTGDPNQAFRAAQEAYLATTAMGVVPLAAPGGLATRLGTGFVSGVVTGEANIQAANAVLPASMQQQPFDIEQMLLSGLSGMMLGGVMGPRGDSTYAAAIRKTYDDALKAQRSEADLRGLRVLGAVAEANPLRTNNPEAFKQFVQTMAKEGDLADVYVNAKNLDAALKQHIADGEALRQQIPEINQQINEQAALNGDVRIPLADYVTHIAGKPIDETLLPNLKTSPDGMTYAEGQKYLQTAQAEMKVQAEKIIAQESVSEQQKADQKAVYDQVLSQLETANHFPSDVNKTYATIATAGYVARAKSAGMSAKELWDAYPLNIEGNLQGADITSGYSAEQAALQQSVRENLRNILHNPSPELVAADIRLNRMLGGDNETLSARIGKAKDKSKLAALMAKGLDNLDPGHIERALADVRKEAEQHVAELAAKHEKAPFNVYEDMLAQTRVLKKMAEDKGYASVDEFLAKEPDEFAKEAKAWREAHPVPERASLKQARQQQTNTPEFKAWFGKSQVVDAEGKPQVMYHGTARDITTFKPKQAEAIFVTKSPVVAGDFAKRSETWKRQHGISDESGQNVMPVFVKADNLFDPDNASHIEAMRKAIGDGWKGPEFANSIEDVKRGAWQALENPIVQKYIKAHYDGFHVYEEGEKNVAVFKPEQIKSAIGNIGTFDPNNPNILRQAVQARQQTNTPEFKKWFGDSKVVDVRGEPLIVYHGAPDARFMKGDATFKNINEQYGGKGGERAFWFASSESIAKTYANDTRAFDYQNAEPGIVAAYLNLRNPLIVNGAGKEWREAQKVGKTSDVIEQAQAGGHDGVIIRNVKDAYNNTPSTKPTDTYVVFSSNQIKSAIGNIGTFDPNNPNILRQAVQPAYTGPERRVDLATRASVDKELAQQLATEEMSKLDPFRQDARAAYIPNTSTIHLLKDADLSSFTHELGHHFLEITDHLADTSPALRADMDKLLNWFGKTSDEWRAMDLKEKTPYHERFAESFERYLLEGHAPSLELRPVFERVRSWMLAVYKGLQGLLRDRPLSEQLTPEVRQVFDRMLATEDAIKQAEAVKNYEPLFASAKEAGISPSEYRDYVTLGERATSDAISDMERKAMRDMQWLSGAKSKALKALQREAKGRRDEVRAEVTAEVEAQPIEQAHKALSESEVKISQASLKEMGFTDAEITKLKPLVSKEGMTPDAAADALDFPSGEVLVRGLLDREDPTHAIDGLTDQRMLERYGELSSPDAIERAANQAIANNARARFMATGLKMLTKSPVSASALAKAAKKIAEDAIARKKVSELYPKQYDIQEAKANREALHAWEEVRSPESAYKAAFTKEFNNLKAAAEKAKQPFDEAKAKQEASQKGEEAKTAAKERIAKRAGLSPEQRAINSQREALLNNRMSRAASDAVDEVRKDVMYLKRLEKKAAQANMRGEFLDQLNNLMGRFDLRTSTRPLPAEHKPLGEWLASEAERLSAVTPDIPGWILDERFKTSYKDLTVEQMRGLFDSARQLEHLARREQRQYQAIRAMEFAQERGAVLDEIRKNWPDAFDEKGEPKGMKPNFVPTIRDATSRMGDKFAGEFLAPETIISLLGGGKFSVVNESLFGRLSTRADYKATRLKQIATDMKPLFDQYSFKEKRDFARKDISTAAGLDVALTRENALVVALLHGNAEGRERLANYGWDEAKQMRIISLLDARDMKLADGIWKLFDENIWPELKDLNDRTRGKAPPKVEPLSYETIHGPARGGYFRLKYDTTLDERIYKMEEGQAVKDLLGGGMGMSAKTNQGSSTERQQGVQLRPRLDLGVFAEAVNESVHDIAYREAVADTIRVLNDKGITNAIKQVVGVEGYRALVNKVRETAAPPRNPSGFVEKTLSIARRNTVINLMSGVKTALQNFTGIVPAFTELPAGTLTAEIGKFYSPKMMDRYNFAMEHSAYMKGRFTSYDRDLQSQAQKLTVKSKLMPETATFLALMGFIDKGVSVPVWNAAFKTGMAKFGNDMNKAVAYADHLVRQTQGSGRELDLPAIMSGHGGYGQLKKVFTMFYSYFNAQLNLLVKHGVISKIEARDNPSKAVGHFAAKFVAIVVMPAVMTEMLMHGITQEDEQPEDTGARYAKSIAKYTFGFFPFVRDIAPGIWAQFDPEARFYGTKLSPVESAAEGVVKGVGAVRDIATQQADEKDIRNLIMATGFTLGVPGKLVADTTDGTRMWLSGETGPEAVVLGPPRK